MPTSSGHSNQFDNATRHRAIFESAIDFAIIATDPDGFVTDWNTGATLILGWTPEEMHGQNAERFFTPEDRVHGQIDKEMSSALKTGRGNDERWHLRKDGSRFWASGEMMALRDPEGTHIGFIKILRDRTAAREEEMRRAVDAEFMRSVLASSNDCIKVLDLDARIEFMSEGGQKVMEVADFDTLRGCSWPDFWEGEAKVHVLAAVEQARQGGIGRFEGPSNTMAGNPRHWDVQVTPMIGSDGTPERLLSISRDVTERRQAELAIQELAETLERRVEERTQERDRAWKHSRDLQMVMGSDGIIHAVNDSWTRLLGWTTDELVGYSFIDFVHAEDQATAQAVFLAPTAAVMASVENRYRHKDGSDRWFAWVANVDGELVFASGRDISAEKAAGENLKATQEQLRQSQKMEAIGQLTGGIAHDFNNMLATITSSLELMNRRIVLNKGSDLTRYLTMASTAAQSAAALIQRLLAFSRKQTLDLQAIEVNSLVAQMQDMLKRTLGENIQFELTLQPGLSLVRSDRNQLENALLNLTINARDAMPAGGLIRIATSYRELDAGYAAMHPDVTAGSYVMVSVSDNGSGMSPEIVAKAFDPFFTTKPIGQGTGLGLSMIYGFTRQTGGHASIHSVAEEGTTVNLYLPVASPGVQTTTTLQQSAARSPQGQGEIVLFVEDEPGVRLVLAEILGELGYIAHESVDATSALAIESTLGHLDLLITDVGLPGINGRQLAEMMRARRPSLRILFITGYASNAAVKSEFLGPGMDMLAKPFTIDALAHKVKQMLGEPNIFETAKSQIDPENFPDLKRS